MQKQFCEIQADSSVHAVSIDPDVRTPLYGILLGKIGQYNIRQIIHLYKYMDNLDSIRDKLAASNSKCKNKNLIMQFLR